MAQVRVFIATSLDGFIAGPNDDLSWLPTDDLPGEGAVDFGAFMAEVGALLMGRRTFDMVAGFDGPWPYGDTPVVVASHRELVTDVPSVSRVEGTMDEVVAAALKAAAGKDVYVDGGTMVQQALAAGLVDELILSVVPILLGGGVPLFGSLEARQKLTFHPPTTYGSMVQLRATVARD